MNNHLFCCLWACFPDMIVLVIRKTVYSCFSPPNHYKKRATLFHSLCLLALKHSRNWFFFYKQYSVPCQYIHTKQMGLRREHVYLTISLCIQCSVHTYYLLNKLLFIIIIRTQKCRPEKILTLVDINVSVEENQWYDISDWASFCCIQAVRKK